MAESNIRNPKNQLLRAKFCSESIYRFYRCTWRLCCLKEADPFNYTSDVQPCSGTLYMTAFTSKRTEQNTVLCFLNQEVNKKFAFFGATHFAVAYILFGFN